MQAVRRLAARCLAASHTTAADAAAGVIAAILTAVAVWSPSRAAVGPWWMLMLLPVLMGAPLVLRRRAPLLAWIALLMVIVTQYLITRQPPQNEDYIIVLFAGYSLGAHASLQRAIVGLGAGAVIIPITRQAALTIFPRHSGTIGLGLDVIPILACWLVGVVVRARRHSVSLTRRNAVLQQQAEQAVAAERARIARELHDIVAHHLSVIVLQAAGARASGRQPEAALEKIENNGRQALTETRRLLAVLRDTGEQTALNPHPGIGELGTLAATLRATGLPVSLNISGDRAAMPAAVDVSVYRIVQEALTNVLKHAGHARADVTVCCEDEAVTIEITDDGTAQPSDHTLAGGLGLAGMRERVAIFSGEMHAGFRTGGGFTVRARLPLDDSMRAPLSIGDRS
jgi:signal transduction histidine kinase